MTVIPPSLRFSSAPALQTQPKLKSVDPNNPYNVATTTEKPKGKGGGKGICCCLGGCAASMLAAFLGFATFGIYTGKVVMEKINAPQAELAYNNELPAARFVGNKGAGLYFPKSNKIRDLAFNFEVGSLNRQGDRTFVSYKTPVLGGEIADVAFADKEGNLYAWVGFDAIASAYKTMTGLEPVEINGNKYIKVATARKEGNRVTLTDIMQRPVAGIELFEDLSLQDAAAAASISADWQNK